MPSSAVTITGSPLRWGTATGAISASKAPAAAAAAARRWLAAAHSSCSARPMPNSVLRRSEVAPIRQLSKAQKRPSCSMRSTMGLCPMRAP